MPSVDVKYAGDINKLFLLVGNPKLLVITRLPVPSLEIATNNVNSELHVTLVHWLFAADVRVIHLIPSELVIIRSPPKPQTATKMDNSALHVTLRHWLSAADALVVHVIPSGDVMTRLPLPD